MAERRSWGVDFNQGLSRSRRLSNGRLATVFSIGMGRFRCGWHAIPKFKQRVVAVFKKFDFHRASFYATCSTSNGSLLKFSLFRLRCLEA
jgi:hypothetical protein